MNKNILKFKEIIETPGNLNACMRALNIDIDSCFLYFIQILEDGILNYNRIVDYKYLVETSNYLLKLFDKLTLKKQTEYKDLIYKMRKVYKRQIQNIDLKNRKYYKKVLNNLNGLIDNYISNDISINSNGRDNQSNEYIITIDDKGSKVLDDGLSIIKLENGNLLFKVYIADPLVMYPYESNIMKEVKLNLDNSSSDDLDFHQLSLAKDKNRYSKSFCYEFDRDGNIVNFYISNSLIKVNERHSYHSINHLYNKGGKNQQEDNMLSYYDDIVKYLRIMFKNVRDYEKMNLKDFVLDDVKISSFSERLVAYSMVLTGYMTAKYMHDNNYPFAYRCNKLANIDDNIKQGLNNKDIKKLETLLSKSFYTSMNVGHEKLGLDVYSHVTSPLRRYIDYLNMHALDVCYFNKSNDKEIYILDDEIKTICDYVNENKDKLKKLIIK